MALKKVDATKVWLEANVQKQQTKGSEQLVRNRTSSTTSSTDETTSS